MDEIAVQGTRRLNGVDEKVLNTLVPSEDLQHGRNGVENEFSPKGFATSKDKVLSTKKSTRENTLDLRWRRLRANDRERRRIQAINDGMEALRQAIPNTRNKRKITKLQLLRLAQDYIRDLNNMLCFDSNFKDDIGGINVAYPTHLGEAYFTN